jgi:hypothetical protein
MRVSLTDYTIRGVSLESWMLERGYIRRIECCFVSLNQTGQSHTGDDQLNIYSFEVFRTLYELQ